MQLNVVSRWYIFFFKQKTAYEMRISDWSSDVCSSDLAVAGEGTRWTARFLITLRSRTTVYDKTPFVLSLSKHRSSFDVAKTGRPPSTDLSVAQDRLRQAQGERVFCARTSERHLMSLALAIVAAIALSNPAAAHTDHPYAPARAIIADIGKIVTPSGVQETFERSEEHTSELQSQTRHSYPIIF